MESALEQLEKMVGRCTGGGRGVPLTCYWGVATHLEGGCRSLEGGMSLTWRGRALTWRGVLLTWRGVATHLGGGQALSCRGGSTHLEGLCVIIGDLTTYTRSRVYPAPRWGRCTS